MKKNLVLALSFALFSAVILPLQTYLPNGSAYAYGLGRLLSEQALVALAVSAAVFALLQASDRWLRGGLTPLVVALAVLLYLASGPLPSEGPERPSSGRGLDCRCGGQGRTSVSVREDSA